jgi:hypothetical protein
MKDTTKSILDHILYPTPADMHVVRIFFWISIITCLLLPRYHVELTQNQTWTVLSYAWIALAVGLRIFVQVRFTKNRQNH